MFNRFVYEKLLTENQEKQINQKIGKKLQLKRQSIKELSSEKYKSKVRNFLVQLAENPIHLGSYQPPIETISRQSPDPDAKILGRSQMIINGYQSIKKRTEDLQEKNKIFDLSPTKSEWGKQSFRERNKEHEIHKKQMTFCFNQSVNKKLSVSVQLHKIKSQILKKFTLPSLLKNSNNPERKTYFKAAQQMANSISTMNQLRSDKLDFQQKLIKATKNKVSKIQPIAFDLLVKSNFIKKRAHSERNLNSFE